MLCDGLEEWDEGEGGRELLVHIVGSLPCTTETQHVKQLYFNSKKKNEITKAPNLIQSQLLLPPPGERPAASKKPP